MAQPKPGLPYFWVSWLTGYFAGEKQCEFAPWFKAHFKYDKRVDAGFDSAKWTEDHTSAVRLRAGQLRGEFDDVTIEDQNSFKLEGRTAIVAGKPDIVAVKPDHILISDCKTGVQRGSDFWQMLVYLAVYRRLSANADVEIDGEISYRERNVPVGAFELTPEREAKIWAVVKKFAAAERLRTTPSPNECGRCDIGECPDRVSADVQQATTTAF